MIARVQLVGQTTLIGFVMLRAQGGQIGQTGVVGKCPAQKVEKLRAIGLAQRGIDRGWIPPVAENQRVRCVGCQLDQGIDQQRVQHEQTERRTPRRQGPGQKRLRQRRQQIAPRQPGGRLRAEAGRNIEHAASGLADSRFERVMYMSGQPARPVTRRHDHPVKGIIPIILHRHHHMARREGAR